MSSIANQPDRSLMGRSLQRLTVADQIESFLKTPVSILLGLGLVAAIAFFNLANLLVDKDVVAIDFQVLIKLGLCGLAGLYGFYGVASSKEVRRVLFSFPVMWVVVINVFYFASVPFSIAPLESLVSTCALSCVLLLTVTVLVKFGVIATLKSIFFGMSLFIVGSWFMYFAVPEIGVFAEPISEGRFTVRMSGLAHPNTLGQYSGLTVLFGIILYTQFKFRSYFAVFIIAIAAMALVNSLSRTSLVATVAGLGVAYRHGFLKKEYFNYYALAIFLSLLAFLALSTQMDIGAWVESKMSVVSKSGDADELTSATGRSEIWSYATYLIGFRPLTGYGPTTSKYYLAEYSSYTHNLILNVTFSAGLIAGLSALLMCLGRLKSMFVTQHVLADGIIVFIIVNGLFENVIFSIISGMPTMIWVLALSWPLLDDPVIGKSQQEDPRLSHQYLRLERG